MHLWIAVKHAPLSMWRDRRTHLSYLRLDKWWMPPCFRFRYAQHTEIIVTHPCTPDCSLCRLIPSDARSKYENKHYVTYSVDNYENEVYRGVKRHIIPPVVIPENNESWTYYRIPMEPLQVMKAVQFLEAQVGKPIRKRYNWNFYLLCRRKGVRLYSDYGEADSWYCSELAAATLIQFCDEFREDNLRDPCLISPCILESQIRDLTNIKETDQIRFRPMGS